MSDLRVKCKHKDCISEAAAGPTYRDLCLKHYGQAKKLVESGKATWEDLAQMGMCGGGEQKDELAAEFERMKRVREVGESRPEA